MLAAGKHFIMYYNMHLIFFGLLFSGLVDRGTAGILGAQDGLICYRFKSVSLVPLDYFSYMIILYFISFYHLR